MDADYIYTHDYAYDYLVLYFLPEIFDPFFREDYAAEIEEDERLAYSRYIAALLPMKRTTTRLFKNYTTKRTLSQRPLCFYNISKSLYCIIIFYLLLRNL